MKLVNNLLACVHLAVAAEGLAFARRKGMDLDEVMKVISSGAAYSYVAVDRAPRMRMANPPVAAAIDTLVKDLQLVIGEAKKHSLPLFLTATAYQQFVAAQANGWGKEDDSCLGRLWEQYGIRIRDE
jgi:3-hydroxyisobutyrate dehydrogenase